MRKRRKHEVAYEVCAICASEELAVRSLYSATELKLGYLCYKISWKALTSAIGSISVVPSESYKRCF